MGLQLSSVNVAEHLLKIRNKKAYTKEEYCALHNLTEEIIALIAACGNTEVFELIGYLKGKNRDLSHTSSKQLLEVKADSFSQDTHNVFVETCSPTGPSGIYSLFLGTYYGHWSTYRNRFIVYTKIESAQKLLAGKVMKQPTSTRTTHGYLVADTEFEEHADQIYSYELDSEGCICGIRAERGSFYR